MSDGHIYVAEYEGVYVIRLVGEVRLTLCVSFDQFIESLFADESARAIVFDLRGALTIDSTTLGLMAKIAIGSSEQGFEKPVVVTNSDSMVKLLVSMGFEDIFVMTQESDIPSASGERPLIEVVSSEDKVKQTVLEAHEILMELNQPNKVKFHELVETLQNKQ